MEDVLCVMDDLNAKVGNKQVEKTVGKYGIGDKNERGERLIGFCEKNKLIIANTFFKHPIRRLYTWKSPGDVIGNQIDYIMINQRFKNSIKNAITYPGADINSDHNPVYIKLQVKLKRTRTKTTFRKEQLDMSKLKKEDYKIKFNVAIKNRYQIVDLEPIKQ